MYRLSKRWVPHLDGCERRLLLTAVARPLVSIATSFPMPVSQDGDVQNRDGAPGGNDSAWMDLSFPVRATRPNDWPG
jgi:hypothetical protein